MSLDINKKRQGSTLEIFLKGSLDTFTAPVLQAELDRSLDEVNKLVFDFSGLTFISSAGLRTMIEAYKAMSGKGQMKIVHVSDVLREVFDVTGLTGKLNIE